MGGAPLSHPSSCDPLRRCLLGLASHCLDSCRSGSRDRYSLESRTSEKSLLLASHLDERRTGQTQQYRALLWARLSLLSSSTSAFVRLVLYCLPSRLDIHYIH